MTGKFPVKAISTDSPHLPPSIIFRFLTLTEGLFYFIFTSDQTYTIIPINRQYTRR